MPSVPITRIFDGPDGRSSFADRRLDVEEHPVTPRTAPFLLGASFMVDTGPLDLDFHRAPCRKLLVVLDGHMEIECGTGERRGFTAGATLLLEDVAGTGHRLRVPEQVVLLSAELGPSALETP